MHAIEAAVIDAQARTILADMHISAFKIGLLGSLQAVEVIDAIVQEYPHIPLVLDPVLRAGGGAPLADQSLCAALRDKLLTRASIATPNRLEAALLSETQDDVDACGLQLLSLGCEHVLITGADTAQESTVENILYSNGERSESFNWPKLSGQYHGSGCTLAAAIAGLLARGKSAYTAIHEAQEYTWEALRQGYRCGRGQLVPNRLFWTQAEDSGA
jgi:hydroxymethylpyrimidine/phosphomethylpyrimidine kinase